MVRRICEAVQLRFTLARAHGTIVLILTGKLIPKSRCLVEYAIPITRFCIVPSSNTPGKFAGIPEHVSHICHLRNVPSTNFLVEHFRRAKHAFHVRHCRHVPSTDILIECFSVFKHPVHFRHLRNVPVRNVRIEVLLIAITKQRVCTHICNLTCIPIRHRSVSRRTSVICALTGTAFSAAVDFAQARRNCGFERRIRERIDRRNGHPRWRMWRERYRRWWWRKWHLRRRRWT